MSNRKLLTRGVIFSYGALLAQIGYSFASIPLALSHLSTAEFGMFGVVATISSFLTMAELGMTESFTRHLFACKDGKDPERFGRLFTAAFLALGVVSLLILAAGISAAMFSAPLLNIPVELRRDFMWVMVGHSVLAAVTIGTRMLGAPLILHHRQDLTQIALIGLFVIYYVVLHFGFKAGWGIYALIANQAVGILWVVPFNALASRRCGYLPRRSALGLPSKAEWKEVRNYSLSTFVIQLGGTFLSGLPQLLISSRVGLDAGGTWTVFTRVFSILKEIAFRPFGIASPMLLDFFVNGEVARSVRLWARVSQVVVAGAGLTFAVAAANNSRFVELWAGIGSDWGLGMHVSIAAYFLCFVAAGCAYGVISFSTSLGIARVIPLLQAVCVAGISYLIADRYGSGGIILTCALGFLFGMLFFGMRQLGRVTGQDALRLFIPAIARPFVVTPLVFACAYGIGRLTESIAGYPGLFVSAACSFVLGLPIMAFLGVSAEARGDLFGMVLKPFGRFLPASLKPAPPVAAKPGGGLDP